MPIYEYQCESCGSQKELFVKLGSDPRPSCPTCRKRMRRVISQTAFILKGSGWYVTDYPSETRKKGMESEKTPATSSEAGGAKKEQAPAPKEKKSPPESSSSTAPPKKSGKRRS